MSAQQEQTWKEQATTDRSTDTRTHLRDDRDRERETFVYCWICRMFTYKEKSFFCSVSTFSSRCFATDMIRLFFWLIVCLFLLLHRLSIAFCFDCFGRHCLPCVHKQFIRNDWESARHSSKRIVKMVKKFDESHSTFSTFIFFFFWMRRNSAVAQHRRSMIRRKRRIDRSTGKTEGNRNKCKEMNKKKNSSETQNDNLSLRAHSWKSMRVIALKSRARTQATLFESLSALQRVVSFWFFAATTWNVLESICSVLAFVAFFCFFH